MRLRVDLDVTVQVDQWLAWMQEPPEHDLPIYVRDTVRREADWLHGTQTSVLLTDSSVARQTPRHITVRVQLQVEADGVAWASRHGVPLVESLPGYLAHVLCCSSGLIHAGGTVVAGAAQPW